MRPSLVCLASFPQMLTAAWCVLILAVEKGLSQRLQHPEVSETLHSLQSVLIMRKTTSYLVVGSWGWYYLELLLGLAACPARLTLHQLFRQQHVYQALVISEMTIICEGQAFSEKVYLQSAQ